METSCSRPQFPWHLLPVRTIADGGYALLLTSVLLSDTAGDEGGDDEESFDSRWLQMKSIEESKRQYMTAGFTSDSNNEVKQTLARLARELAALSYVGNSSYTGLVQRRTQILKQLCEIYERELRVLKSGTSVARKLRSKRFPTTLQIALESGVHMMLELLEDSLHTSPRVCSRVLRRLGLMLKTQGLLSLSVCACGCVVSKHEYG